MTNEQLAKLQNAGNYYTAMKVAEELTYEISYEKRQDQMRTRHSYIYADDLRRFGWNVFGIGANKDFKEFIIDQYKPLETTWHNKIFVNSETKTVLIVDDYKSENPLIIGITQGFGEHDNVYNKIFLSLDEYKELLIKELEELEDNVASFRSFVESLILQNKAYYEEMIEEETRQKIIDEALEKARKLNIIK